jgi:hypothetical protein
MPIDTTRDDADLFDFASFDTLPGRPVRQGAPEEDKTQRELARDVEAAPFRAEHLGLA